MSFDNRLGIRRIRGWTSLLITLILLFPAGLPAQEFSASTPPRSRYSLRIFPKVLYTSAHFSDSGKALNLTEVTGLLYVEVPLQVQYGLTGSLALGAILPVGWAYQEVHPTIREHPIHRWAVREFWLTLQHRFWTLPFLSASALHVKIPLAGKEPWEDGLQIGDGQIDVYPQYYFDYFNKTHYWFARLSVGYKYRFKKGELKPFDELRFKPTVGLEVWDRPKIDFFLFADLTQFRNGNFGEGERAFFEKGGSLHTFGYGVSFSPYPLMQIYIDTAGDLSGRNRYRSMRWTVGFRQVFG